ncbi:uncharacterized protein SCODWIG_02361 [Saccharomycodes ludwigii]|uniref:Uncharacterized protein n=1 Tax=Saccharomycodes ludwigii TaxID=36035 RepID=A0A376B8Z6_9ASCO|nr:uncharacterized protein SCODWIG_02361 [Saccharomycodes ludwigii]
MPSRSSGNAMGKNSSGSDSSGSSTIVTTDQNFTTTLSDPTINSNNKYILKKQQLLSILSSFGSDASDNSSTGSAVDLSEILLHIINNNTDSTEDNNKIEHISIVIIRDLLLMLHNKCGELINSSSTSVDNTVFNLVYLLIKLLSKISLDGIDQNINDSAISKIWGEKTLFTLNGSLTPFNAFDLRIIQLFNNSGDTFSIGLLAVFFITHKELRKYLPPQSNISKNNDNNNKGSIGFLQILNILQLFPSVDYDLLKYLNLGNLNDLFINQWIYDYHLVHDSDTITLLFMTRTLNAISQKNDLAFIDFIIVLILPKLCSDNKNNNLSTLQVNQGALELFNYVKFKLCKRAVQQSGGSNIIAPADMKNYTAFLVTRYDMANDKKQDCILTNMTPVNSLKTFLEVIDHPETDFLENPYFTFLIRLAYSNLYQLSLNRKNYMLETHNTLIDILKSTLSMPAVLNMSNFVLIDYLIKITSVATAAGSSCVIGDSHTSIMKEFKEKILFKIPPISRSLFTFGTNKVELLGESSNFSELTELLIESLSLGLSTLNNLLEIYQACNIQLFSVDIARDGEPPSENISTSIKFKECYEFCELFFIPITSVLMLLSQLQDNLYPVLAGTAVGKVDIWIRELTILTTKILEKIIINGGHIALYSFVKFISKYSLKSLSVKDQSLRFLNHLFFHNKDNVCLNMCNENELTKEIVVKYIELWNDGSPIFFTFYDKIVGRPLLSGSTKRFTMQELLLKYDSRFKKSLELLTECQAKGSNANENIILSSSPVSSPLQQKMNMYSQSDANNTSSTIGSFANDILDGGNNNPISINKFNRNATSFIPSSPSKMSGVRSISISGLPAVNSSYYGGSNNNINNRNNMRTMSSNINPNHTIEGLITNPNVSGGGHHMNNDIGGFSGNNRNNIQLRSPVRSVSNVSHGANMMLSSINTASHITGESSSILLPSEHVGNSNNNNGNWMAAYANNMNSTPTSATFKTPGSLLIPKNIRSQKNGINNVNNYVNNYNGNNVNGNNNNNNGNSNNNTDNNSFLNNKDGNISNVTGASSKQIDAGKKYILGGHNRMINNSRAQSIHVDEYERFY